MIPETMRRKDFKRSIRKAYIETESKYVNDIHELYRYVTDKDNGYKTIKNCYLNDGHMFSMVANKRYIMFFLLNNNTDEIFDLLIIDCIK